MFTKILKYKLIDKDITASELAERLGTSQQNLSGKMLRDNFSTKDMQEIAKALNCKLEIKLTDLD